MDEKTRQQIALFRYGLIADLVHRKAGERGLYALLREKAEWSYEIPGYRRTRVAVETIRDWLAAYRRGGFDALYPKLRRDQGQARAIPQEVADLLCAIKEDNRALSVTLVIEQAQRSGAVPESVVLAPATVHRLLSRHGLMDKKVCEPTTKDRRRFAFDKANELWMSDVMHGPSVFADEKRKRKTYLIATLDDATRVVPYAAFAMHENTAAFLACSANSHPPPRNPQKTLRRQRLRLPLSTPRARLRQARHHPHPRSPLPASGQRKTRTLVSHRAQALLHGPEQIADLPVPVAESPGAVRIGHPERSHLVEYLAPNSVFNSLPRQRSSPHLRPDDRLVTIDRVLHHASLGVA